MPPFRGCSKPGRVSVYDGAGMSAPKAIRPILVLSDGPARGARWLEAGLSAFHGIAVPARLGSSGTLEWTRPDASALESGLAPPLVPLLQLSAAPSPSSLQALRPALTSPRAICVGNRPLVLRSGAAEPAALLEALDREAAAWGVGGVTLVALETGPGAAERWAPRATEALAGDAAAQRAYEATLCERVAALRTRPREQRLLFVPEPVGDVGLAAWVTALELLRDALRDATELEPALADVPAASAHVLRAHLTAQQRSLTAFREALRRTTAALEARDAELVRLRREPGFWLVEAARERVVQRPQVHARVRAAIAAWRRLRGG